MNNSFLCAGNQNAECCWRKITQRGRLITSWRPLRKALAIIQQSSQYSLIILLSHSLLKPFPHFSNFWFPHFAITLSDDHLVPNSHGKQKSPEGSALNSPLVSIGSSQVCAQLSLPPMTTERLYPHSFLEPIPSCTLWKRTVLTLPSSLVLSTYHSLLEPSHQQLELLKQISALLLQSNRKLCPLSTTLCHCPRFSFFPS